MLIKLDKLNTLDELVVEIREMKQEQREMKKEQRQTTNAVWELSQMIQKVLWEPSQVMQKDLADLKRYVAELNERIETLEQTH